MSATIIILPNTRKEQAAPPVPLDRLEAVFRCLVCLAEAETYHDAGRFLAMLHAQGFMVVRLPDDPAA